MSKKNKKAFIESIRKDLNAIDPGNKSIDIIVKSIENMSAAQFEDYIARLRNGILDNPDLNKPRELIAIVIPDLTHTKITVRKNIDLIEKWGWNVMQKAWLVDPVTKQRYLTNRPYVALELPVVRQSQTLEHKMAIAKSDTLLDSRTGSSAKTVAGSALSGPEVQALLSQGREAAVMEMMKFRGGDDRAYREMSRAQMETGRFSMKAYNEPTRAKSSDAVNIYLKASHLDNNV